MKYTIILLLLLPNLCLGQDSVTIEGKVLDAENREPISYANIGFPSVNIGTASQRDGTFKLKLPKDLKDDSLQISAIGYNTDKVHVSTFLDSERVRFQLTPKTYQLESITVTDKKNPNGLVKKYLQLWEVHLMDFEPIQRGWEQLLPLGLRGIRNYQLKFFTQESC